jgi:hypothetical protein
MSVTEKNYYCIGLDEALAVARQNAELAPGDLMLQLGGTPAIVL